MINFRLILIIICIFFIQTTVCAIQYANIEYDIPIDYSKIDKNALADQANSLFIYFEQITDKQYRKKYIQPLLNRYSVLSVISPDDPFNYTRLGILYDEIQQDKYAKTNFYKAINILPKYPYANYAFGNYYYKRGYFRRALEYYKKAENLPTPYSYDRNIKIASVYEKLGDYKSAINNYKKAYEENNSQQLYDKILLLEDLNSKNILYH